MDCGKKCEYGLSRKLKCDAVDLPILSKEDYDQLFVIKEIKKNLYLGMLNNISVWIKYSGITLGSEICTQHKASIHGLAPKIIGFWNCSDKKYGCIVMEDVGGILIELDKSSINDDLLLTVAKLNDIGVIHGDIMNGVIKIGNKIMFVDFEEANFTYEDNKYQDIETIVDKFPDLYRIEWDKYGPDDEMTSIIDDVIKNHRIVSDVERKLECSKSGELISCPEPISDVKIPQLSQEELISIKVGDRLGEGTYGKVYNAKMGQQNVAVKYFRGKINEACIQDVAASKGLAPKVLSYWKCANVRDRNILIMERVDGITLANFISKNNDEIIPTILCEIVRLIYILNFELNIKHNDLHTNNILYDENTKSIKFIDYGMAKVLKFDDVFGLLDLEYKDAFSDDKLKDYFSDFVMVMNRASVMISKKLDNKYKSFSLIDTIAVNNLDDYSGWYKIFQSNKKGKDITADGLSNIILKIFSSPKVDNNLISKFNLYPLNNSQIVRCSDIKEKLYIKSLSSSELQSIKVYDVMIKELSVTVYNATMNNTPYSLFYIVSGKVPASKQLCIMKLQNEHDISPKAIGYFKCSNSNFILLLTEKINGIALNRYIIYNDKTVTFKRLLKAIISLNIGSYIINKHITYSNILINEKSINILSSAVSKQVKDQHMLMEFSGEKDYDIYYDVIAISNMFNMLGDQKVKAFIQKYKLINPLAWRKIYRNLYNEDKAIPQWYRIYNHIISLMK